MCTDCNLHVICWQWIAQHCEKSVIPFQYQFCSSSIGNRLNFTTWSSLFILHTDDEWLILDAAYLFLWEGMKEYKQQQATEMNK